MHVIAHRGFMNTITLRESALKVESGRKVVCCPTSIRFKGMSDRMLSVLMMMIAFI